MRFEIVCDGAADLSMNYINEAGIKVVPFYVSMDSKEYLKEGMEISIHEFYQEMADHGDCFPKTSMPSVQDYMDAFLPMVKKRFPVLCICLTRKFSGSMQSAITAKETIEEEYPEACIQVMDSQLVTDLEGQFVKEAIRLRDLELSMEQTIPLLEEIRKTGQIFFTTKDLKYLQHGGRLGKVACIAGNILNLKPVLHFYDGELGTTEVCRGRKKSLEKVIEHFITYLKKNQIDLKKYLFVTGVGLKTSEYDEFKEMLQARFEQEEIQPEYWDEMQIGATIGVHTGPFPVGLGILKKCEI